MRGGVGLKVTNILRISVSHEELTSTLEQSLEKQGYKVVAFSNLGIIYEKQWNTSLCWEYENGKQEEN